jgi:hypothetical protein
MLGAGLEPERKQIGDSHADIAARCGHDNADLRVVVGEHLPVPTARGLDPSAVTAHSNDVGDFSGAAGAGGAQRDKFSTRAAGEVVEVHSNEHSAVRSSNSSAHGVNPIFTGSGVGVRVDCPASLVHQLHVLSAERTGRRRHHVHVQTLTCGRSSIRSLDRLIEPNAPIVGWPPCRCTPGRSGHRTVTYTVCGAMGSQPPHSLTGAQTWGAPKSYERREVPVPRFLADLLAAHVVGSRMISCSAVTGPAKRFWCWCSGVPRSTRRRRRSGSRSATTRFAAHRGVLGDRVGRLDQGCAGHARARFGDGNPGPYGHLYGDQLDDLAEGCTRQPRRPAKLLRTPCGLKAINQSANLGRTAIGNEYGPCSCVPPAGFEPALLPPEGSALSPELRGPCGPSNRPPRRPIGRPES